MENCTWVSNTHKKASKQANKHAKRCKAMRTNHLESGNNIHFVCLQINANQIHKSNVSINRALRFIHVLDVRDTSPPIIQQSQRFPRHE